MLLATLVFTACGAVIGAFWGTSRKLCSAEGTMYIALTALLTAVGSTWIWAMGSIALLVGCVSGILASRAVPHLESRYHYEVDEWCRPRGIHPSAAWNLREVRRVAKSLRGLTPEAAEVLQVLWKDAGEAQAAEIPQLAAAARAVTA